MKKQKYFFKEIEKKKTFFLKNFLNRKKNVDKRGFMKYFSNKPTALGNNLLGQNTQDLRKSLDDIKQQNIELDKDEGNSTNNKNENDNDNVSV